jgi:molecular chaperone DnaK
MEPTNRFLPPEQRERQALIDWLLSRAFEQTGVKVADDPMARQRIGEAAQKAVEELRFQASVTVSLPFLTADAKGPKHFQVQLTRETLKRLS